jgi:outer membrane lipoprotein-sorting protein
MKAPPILQRHRSLRWLMPVGVVCVAGLAATGIFKANASSESLPETTPAALIAAVQHTRVEGFSGTVISHLSLGLPELPSLTTVGEETSFDALLSGSHTLQVWYGGLDKQRIALLGATDETDLFRNGRTVWQWSSADRVALHTRLPARGRADADTPTPSVASSLTPSQLAHRALGALDPTTKVTIEGDHTVADRSAYELVLTPRTDATKVASIHISIDGETKVPLGVQVYPRGSSSAAIDVAFTSIRFARQPSQNFEFTPPPNAQVRKLRLATDSSTARPHVTKTGSSWTAVVELKPGKKAVTSFGKGTLGKELTPVAGSWGTGRLLDSALVSVLVTHDGRVYAGAVDPVELYAAAGSK